MKKIIFLSLVLMAACTTQAQTDSIKALINLYERQINLVNLYHQLRLEYVEMGKDKALKLSEEVWIDIVENRKRIQRLTPMKYRGMELKNQPFLRLNDKQ